MPLAATGWVLGEFLFDVRGGGSENLPMWLPFWDFASSLFFVSKLLDTCEA